MALTTSRSPPKSGAIRRPERWAAMISFEGHDGSSRSISNTRRRLFVARTGDDQDTEQYGGTFRMPVTHSLSLVPRRSEKSRTGARRPGDRNGRELQADRKMEHQARRAQRFTQGYSPVVPLTQIQGSARTRWQVKFDHPLGAAYGFGQYTVARRWPEDNVAIGVGGSYRLTKRFGSTGKLPTVTSDRRNSALAFSIRTDTFYLNYSLENEQTDNGLLLPGSQGNWSRA